MPVSKPQTHTLTIDATLAAVDSHTTGLAATEAAARLTRQAGTNGAWSDVRSSPRLCLLISGIVPVEKQQAHACVRDSVSDDRRRKAPRARG